MPINNVKWTDEQVEQLRALYAQGLSCSQIGRAIGGYTRNAVIGKIHRLGIGGREPPRRARQSTPRPRVTGSRRHRQNITRLFAIANDHDPGFVEIPVVDDLAIPTEQRKALLDLTHETCRYPVGDPSTKDFFFCGALPKAGSPYCAGHHHLAYTAPAPRRRTQNRDDATRHFREEAA